MGGNMARRLARRKVNVIGFDRSAAKHAPFSDEPGLTATDSLDTLIAGLKSPRVVWLMLPAGAPTEGIMNALAALMQAGDVIVDGANAYYRDSMRHATELQSRGLRFVDAGVSGGIWGLENGYALMLGGSAEAVERVRPFAELLAPGPDAGWVHCGPAGSGHFVKMIHNGIEYGLMQAYAEGFALMREKKEFGLDLGAIAECWRHGSVIRSWLLDLTAPLLTDRRAIGGCGAGGRRFGRGALDRTRSGRARRARSRDEPRPDDAFRQPGPKRLCGATPGRNAPCVRRSRDQERRSVSLKSVQPRLRHRRTLLRCRARREGQGYLPVP